MSNGESMTRVFIVGCPRSGTTLLQSLLAAHPQAVSFPESHLFNRLHPRRLERWLDVLRRGMRDHLVAYFEALERPDLAERFADWRLRREAYVAPFIECLDEIARDQGVSTWIEKTPSHLVRIPIIERHLDRPRFIHIMRRGVDVVASLYKVTHDYPEAWDGERTLDEVIDRWIADLERSERHLDKPNHTAVQYETLLQRPEQELERLCSFIGLDYEASMLVDYRQAAGEVVAEGEAWKDRNTGPLREPSSQKFMSIFDKEQRDYIRARLTEAVDDWPIE